MVRRYSIFSSRRRTRPPNLPGSPSNISSAEQAKSLEHVNHALAKANYNYAFHIVHGGQEEVKLRDRRRIMELEAEKKSIQNMEPLGGHIQRAEKTP